MTASPFLSSSRSQPQRCRGWLPHPRLSALVSGTPKSLQDLCKTNTSIGTRLNPRGAVPRVSFLIVIWLEEGGAGAAAALL